jgi:hypothetical protein
MTYTTDRVSISTPESSVLDSHTLENGDIIHQDDIILSRYGEGKVCCIWQYDSNIVAIVHQDNERDQYSSFCKSDCPERLSGLCDGGNAMNINEVIELVGSAGCPECMNCIHSCKMNEPCVFREEKQ